MSVIGIDFGNESCYVAAAKAGGIETLANDYSLRATPSCVAFAGKKRVLGVAAKNQQITNMKNTIGNFKRFLGRKFNDPHVQHELKTIPYRVEPTSDGGIGIRVNYLDEEHVFTPEQLTAMLFTKLKETSVTALQAQVNDCVITCPVYYTNAERRALLDAASIAGLNVLRLLNETTATALSYGFYRHDLPEDKPKNVIFVDCGHASLQVSACAFTKGKLKMLACSWEQIGGRDFDAVLAEYFAKEFYEKLKLNAKTNARAYLRLLAEVEKVKKQMSANSTKLPLNIECFMEEIDVHSSIQRTIMEELCADLFEKVGQTLRKCLKDSKLTLDEIDSVEIVGGSSRIPAIKALIEQTFGKPASTTLNQDESVSRGAALQCATLSPALRVREFSLTDIQNYPVQVSWDGENNIQSGELEVFPPFHAAPFSRVLTLVRREPFYIKVAYSQPIPYPDPKIGRWCIKDVKPNEKGEAQEVKVKVRINHHGIVLISNAILVEKKETEEPPAAAIDNVNDKPEIPGSTDTSTTPTTTATGSTEQTTSAAAAGTEQMEINQEDCDDGDTNDDKKYDDSPTASSPGGQGWTQRVKGWFTSGSGEQKKKKISKQIELMLEGKTHGHSTKDLINLHNEEAKMIANDQLEKERVDARNSLEEYVYDMREKLQEGGSLARYVAETERSSICSQLNDLENWLYEEGEDCDRDTYKSKLSVLHQQTDPIKNRYQEFETQPQAFDELGHAIQQTRKAVNEYRSGTAKYEHLTETEILNISEAADKSQKWLDETLGKFCTASRTVDPPSKLHDIRHEYQILTTCVQTVLNRAKPKPPSPPTPAAKPTDQQQQNGDVNGSGDKNAEQSSENSTMEVE